MKVKPFSVHRETVASTMRVNPGLLEKQKRQQRRQQQSCVNTSENEVRLHKQKDPFREDRIWTTILGCQTCRKHSVETLIFKYVYFDTMISGKRRGESNILGFHTFSIENKNYEINWEENSRMKIGCIAFYRRSFTTRFEICKDEDG